MHELRGLSLTLPYPYLIVAEALRPGTGKCIETRGWSYAPRYRGRVAIHAARSLSAVGARFGLRALVSDPVFFETLRHLVPNNDRSCDVDAIIEAMPRGVIVAVARLATVYRFGTETMRDVDTGEDLPLPALPERAFGNYAPGRFGFRLDDIQPLRTPIRCAGALSLWHVPADVQAEIEAQLTVVAA